MMITPVRPWPSGPGSDMVRQGTTPAGTLRERGRPLLREYACAGHAPDVKRQSVALALQASGMREPAQGLHGSPPTVLNE